MAQRRPSLQTQTGNDMGSPRSLCNIHHSPNCVRYVPYLCSTKRVSVIRRPPGSGRSAFLSSVADCLDVLSPRPCKEPWSERLQKSRPCFNFNHGLILHLDLGCLSYETYENLEENVADLLRSAVTRFLDKYQSYIGFSDKVRTEVLAQRDPNGLLEDAMYLALTPDYPNVFTYVCVDNYTAPYEKARAKNWPQIAAILDRALFRPLMSLVAAEYIDSGLLIGSSEMDEEPMASLTSEKPEVDEWGDDAHDDFPPPVPFAGPLSPFATDWTHEPLMEAAIGVSQEQVVDLGRAVLGDEAQALALQERVSKLPSRTFSDSPNAERVWSPEHALEMLRDMAATPEVQEGVREDS